MALMKEDLWGIVNETETPPGRDAPAGTITKYRTRKDRALAIYNCVWYQSVVVIPDR